MTADDDFDWTENPVIVAAHLLGDDPDLEAFAYCEELVCSICGVSVNGPHVCAPMITDVFPE